MLPKQEVASKSPEEIGHKLLHLPPGLLIWEGGGGTQEPVFITNSDLMIMLWSGDHILRNADI